MQQLHHKQTIPTTNTQPIQEEKPTDKQTSKTTNMWHTFWREIGYGGASCSEWSAVEASSDVMGLMGLEEREKSGLRGFWLAFPLSSLCPTKWERWVWMHWAKFSQVFRRAWIGFCCDISVPNRTPKSKLRLAFGSKVQSFIFCSFFHRKRYRPLGPFGFSHEHTHICKCNSAAV